MLNIEKYRNELSEVNEALDCRICALRKNGKCYENHCAECRAESIEWLLSEAQILDDAEKRYLRSVIKPFRNDVLGIKKKECAIDECIAIVMKDYEIIYLPLFKEGTMYKGMEGNRRYTIEELGL